MAGGTGLTRGQIWWARLPAPDKTRPVVLVSREDAYARRLKFIVAPVTRRMRGTPSEVRVGAADGLPVESVVSCDNLRTVRRTLLVTRIGTLSSDKLAEVDRSLKFALGLE